jgi:hypothetical protein
VGAALPAASGVVGGGAGAVAEGCLVETKDGARQAAGSAAAVAMDHARIRDGAGKWRSCLWSGGPTTTERPDARCSKQSISTFLAIILIINWVGKLGHWALYFGRRLPIYCYICGLMGAWNWALGVHLG